MADEKRAESRASDGMPEAPKSFARSTKRIACLEGDWDSWRDDSSVRPLLQVLEDRTNCKHYYRRCNTKAEFEYCLTKLAKAPGYQMIYLSFHGRPGRIENESGNLCLTLEELAELMGTRFAGRIIHFGTCGTLKCQPSRIAQFIEATQVGLVTGFNKNINWIESSAFDLIYFGLWTKYKKDVTRFANGLNVSYSQLIERLGFVIYPLPGGS